MIYEFCNTYNIYKYCAVEADSLEEAIIRLQLPENKFERKSEKEKLHVFFLKNYLIYLKTKIIIQ